MGLDWGLLKSKTGLKRGARCGFRCGLSSPSELSQFLTPSGVFWSLQKAIGTSSSIFKGVQYFHNTEFTNFSTIGG